MKPCAQRQADRKARIKAKGLKFHKVIIPDTEQDMAKINRAANRLVAAFEKNRSE